MLVTPTAVQQAAQHPSVRELKPCGRVDFRTGASSKLRLNTVESPEDRTVEVLAALQDVDEELLYLYFENKRRSGGGPLVSVEKKGDCAVLGFKDEEAAARVLFKGHHLVQQVQLSAGTVYGVKPTTHT